MSKHKKNFLPSIKSQLGRITLYIMLILIGGFIGYSLATVYEKAPGVDNSIPTNSEPTAGVWEKAGKQIDEAHTKPTVYIFLKKNVTEGQVQSLILELKQIPQVEKTTYTSQLDAYNQFRQQNKDNKVLLDLADPDIFPISVTVKLSDRSALDTILQIAKSKPYYEQVRYP